MIMSALARLAAERSGSANEGIAMSAKPIIEIAGVSKWFGSHQVLKDLDLSIAQGSTAVICGPSGSGKSTLLRCINGLEQFQRGTIRVLDQQISDKVLSSGSFRAQIG